MPRLQVSEVDQHGLHSGVAFLVAGEEQLREDGVDMFLHSLSRNEQGGPDCGVGFARGHGSQDFRLPGRQRPFQPATRVRSIRHDPRFRPTSSHLPQMVGLHGADSLLW